MRRQDFIYFRVFSIIAAALVLLFIINTYIAFRIDLTEEGRYSLHPATKEILDQVSEPLEIEIVLTGRLPGGMRRLQIEIEETIRTFNAYSNERISYYFHDPLALTGEEQQEYIFTLSEYGINPTNLHLTVDGGQSTRLIFPGVVIRDSEFETGVVLLKGEQGMSPDEILNLSIENLEFELINGIRKLITTQQHAVGLIVGQGEMEEDDGFGMVEALVEDHEVYKVPLAEARSVEDLIDFEVLIVAGPRVVYSERSKYLLDQYLMSGGKLMFMIDQMVVDLALASGTGTTAMPFDTGLDDLLFRYGVRINRDLVQDLNFGYHPVMTGDFGGQPQITPLPWPFYVVAGRMADHPITKGLDQIIFRFVSTIDTVKADGVTKTPLVFTSDYTRRLAAPARVAFEDMAQEPDISLFQERAIPLVYLLEGDFTSFFRNRFLPEGVDKAGFKETGNTGMVMVVGDGNIIKSMLQPASGEPLSLGRDPYTGNEYANRLFLQNAVNYMINPEGIISSRVKQFQIRPLNKVKLRSQRTFWQAINVVLPVFIVFLIGFIKVSWRKSTYGKYIKRHNI
ncbi:gliding motility-associated ABC transporter substrate-binding protein GldG [Anditalea andensis]|uniref:Gliding motility protein GldG n=1 Tax=Anditalea andensis TaxID=1048983 RepID=A0A074L1Q2_9BACT|nr:gliding motility-associated ABC transporter substrate-binding protein GldG [Anditalea andensis]KEO75084.1 gliding motility protein GldG [Anditalea andensis]